MASPLADGSFDLANTQLNVEKLADKTEVCPGETVTYTLITRLLGGAPGIEIRNISVTDSALPGVVLTSSSPEFVASSDVGGDGVITFTDADNNGISDEEFVWTYTLVVTEDFTNMAADQGDIFFNDVFQAQAQNSDMVTVTVNDNLCQDQIDFMVTIDAPMVGEQVMFMINPDFDFDTAVLIPGDGSAPIPFELQPDGSYAVKYTYTGEGTFSPLVEITLLDGTVISSVPASVEVVAATEVIPTMGEWGLIILGLILLCVMVTAMKQSNYLVHEA